MYLFWGNPAAKKPHYDLAGLIERRQPDGLPPARLGPARPNTKFAGRTARLPFTERYRHALYGLVAMAIAFLGFLQYRVIRRVERGDKTAS
jgi:hypothetical protein